MEAKRGSVGLIGQRKNLAEDSIESEMDQRRQSENVIKQTAVNAPVILSSAYGGMSVKSTLAARRGLMSAAGAASSKTSGRHKISRMGSSNMSPKRLEIVIGKQFELFRVQGSEEDHMSHLQPQGTLFSASKT